MKNIGIIAFNSALKTKKMQEAKNLEFINLDVTIRGKSYVDKDILELDQEVKKYKEIPKTSQPTTEEFLVKYKKMLGKYDEVLVLTPSQDLSGTHQNALLSRSMLDKGEKEKIYIVETKSFALSEALLCDMAIDMIQKTENIDEIILNLEKTSKKITTFIIPGNFEYLKMSGRINLAQLVISKIMMLKLLIRHKKGIAQVYKKGREFKKILKQIKQDLDSEIYKDIQKIYISGLAADFEQYEKLKEVLEKKAEVVEAPVGSVIMAAHFGPKTLGYLVLEK